LLGSGLTLIYTADKPESIALVGDVAKFCRPDLVLWCVDSRNVAKQEALETLAQANRRLKPARGVFLISSEPWAESEETEKTQALNASIEGEAPRIRVLTAGFDSAKLMPVLEALG
jgi:hypothetical protein